MAIKHRFDFTDVWARLSTWLSILAGGASAALIAYAALPDRVQNAFPEAVLLALGAMAVGIPFLLPLATSFKQRGLGRANQVEISKTVKVEGDVSSEDATRIAEAVHDAAAPKA